MIIGISGYIGSGKDTIAKMIQYLSSIENGSRLASISDFNTYDYTKISKLEVKKFAGKLKQIVSLLTGYSVEQLEEEDIKNSFLSNEWNSIVGGEVHQMTVRELLQKLGTNAMRNEVHPDIHINALFADYIEDSGFKYNVKHIEGNQFQVLEDPKPYSNGYPNWIISDLRFENEAQAILDRDGYTVRVTRRDEKAEFIYDVTGFPKARHSSETSLDNYKFDYYIDNFGTIKDLLEEVKKMLKTFELWKQGDN